MSNKITLAIWLVRNPNVHAQLVESGAVRVFSRDPGLWHLANFRVSSVVSGPSVILVPTENADKFHDPVANWIAEQIV